MSDKNTNTEKPENNVVFVGKMNKWNADKEDYERALRPAPPFVQVVREKIELPEGVEAGKPFYSEHAEKLIAASRDFLPVNSADQPETDLPEDFPAREVLRGLGINLADAKTLDRDGLLKLPGIGEKSADKIISFLENLSEEGEEKDNG